MKKLKRCVWVWESHHDFYETSCGKAFVVEHGTLAENNMKFCCYCGKPIKEER